MSISGVSLSQGLVQSPQATQVQRPEPNRETSGPAFSERISGALEQVANSSNSAAEAARNYELGHTDDLAAVMVEQQVSSLGFQLTLQVRNKALTAYRDIMNMPV